MTKNVTLSMDEDLLAAGRKYAKEHNTTFNALVRDIVGRTVRANSKERTQMMMELMRNAKGDSNGWKWNREGVYER